MRAHDPTRSERIRRSYHFMIEHERAGTAFTVAAIAAATGWRDGTIRTYLKKKWRKLVTNDRGQLRVAGVVSYSEAEYLRLMSQNDELSADPKKPDLVPEVEALVRKAREAALLGLHIYNSPATVFKTEGYSVMMVIAWTALFHAIFQRQGKPYYYLDSEGKPKIIDGDEKAWELTKCISEFYGGTRCPEKANLEFFIALRNKIEHRYVPSIDPHVAGECQSLLFNFDELLTSEFGGYFAIRESLAVPLQTGTIRTIAHLESLKKLQARHFDEVKTFIDGFRSTLPPEINENQNYAFRVFLVPRIGNHRNSSDLAIEFVKIDGADATVQLNQAIVAIKDRQIPVASKGLLKPKDVAKLVASKLGKPFTLHHHTVAWKRYDVRKADYDPRTCNTKYCVPDELHKDYGYTPAWVAFLVDKLSDADEYAVLTSRSVVQV